MREQDALDAAADDEPRGAHSERSTDAMQSHSGRNAVGMLPKQTRPTHTKANQTNAHSARDGLSHIGPEVQAAGEGITGQPITTAGFKQESELDRLCDDHGTEAVVAAFGAVSDGKRKSWRQLVWDSVKYLEPLSDGRRPTDEDEAEALRREWVGA